MKALGIDPGITGGLAFVYCTDGTAPILEAAYDIPVVGTGAKTRIDALAVRALIRQHRPDLAFLERGQAMPQQGASSGFLYGKACGAIEAIISLAEISLEVIEPAKWKHALKLPGKDKERARAYAVQLFPSAHPYLARKRDHGRAEAALIALYGIRTSRSIVAAPPGAQPGSNMKPTQQLDLFAELAK